MHKYVPKLNLPLDIAKTKLYTNSASMDTSMRMPSMENSPEVPSFKDVMTGMVKELDSTVKAPDTVMQDVLLGNGADVHDLMIAISKAEVGVNITTQMITKVVQAYDKVMQIQV